MRSGCDSALIYDTLIQLKKESEYKKFEGKSIFITRVGASAASILGGLLALLTLRVPFYVNIATSALMLPIALSLIEPQRKKLESASPFKDILRICRFSFANVQLRFLMIYGALILSSGAVGVWSYFLYYESLGISVGYFGALFAVFQLFSAYGAKKAHVLEKILGEKKSLFVLLLIAPVFILLGIIKSIFLIPLIFFNAFIWGFSAPIFYDFINRVIKSDIRATVLSVAHMAGSLSFVILSPVFGKLVALFSLSAAHIILGIYFLVYGSIALFFRGEIK